MTIFEKVMTDYKNVSPNTPLYLYIDMYSMHRNGIARTTNSNTLFITPSNRSTMVNALERILNVYHTLQHMSPSYHAEVVEPTIFATHKAHYT